MRLELGRRADYAIRAVVDLARHGSATPRRNARSIAEAMDIPVSYVPQVLADLVRAKVCVSVAGPGGGYELARPIGQITLREVIEAVDGDLVSTECVLRGGPCRWEEMCAVHVPWASAQQALLEVLASTTFATIVDLDLQLEEGVITPAPALVDDRRKNHGSNG